MTSASPDADPVDAGAGEAAPGSATDGPETALPSVAARAVAFAAVIAGGIGGAVIGYAFATLQCGTHQSCTTSRSLFLWFGSLLGAAGVATVAVLTLRALGEWHTIRDDDQPLRRRPRAAAPGADDR